MDVKAKERGILKLDGRPRVVVDTGRELTPQGSCDYPPSSPQPSVDRLSVTWAEPGSMSSSGVNLFHLPTETPVSNEVKFSASAGEGSDDEDYSASLSAVLRQRRASVRRSRKGRSRRPSSPFLADENRPRRRSSVFTTSSGDTAISMEEAQTTVVTQEQIFENIHLHKEVLGSVKQQPLGMRRKLKIVNQAKTYIKRHEGQLQERLAQSKSTRDIYARINILINGKLQQMKREAANTSNLLIPWELRIKEIESHFGSVVASYFTFLRWLFWVNLVIGFILLVFVIVPEYLTADAKQDGERKIIMEDEERNATNLLTLWEFEGVLKCSPIFYGYYSNVERPQYRMPLAYFLTGLAVYIYSFVAILKKMAENSRMSKLSEKEDECIFSWKLFTGWDFMIGNTETAHNRIASVILGFKEALLEEAEKKKDLGNWRIISLRALVNICVIVLLAVSAFAVVTVVSHSDNNLKVRSWWGENETTIVVTVISITFPVFFELLGFLEHYHPRKQLRLQLARIMLLNLLNLYSLIFALFNKIDGMSKDLDMLKPPLNLNATIANGTLNINESLVFIPVSCIETEVPCEPCSLHLNLSTNFRNDTKFIVSSSSPYGVPQIPQQLTVLASKKLSRHSRDRFVYNDDTTKGIDTTTLSNIALGLKELEKLRNLIKNIKTPVVTENTFSSKSDDYDDYSDELSTIKFDDQTSTLDYTDSSYKSSNSDFTSQTLTYDDTSTTEIFTSATDELYSESSIDSYSDPTNTISQSYTDETISNTFEPTTEVTSISSIIEDFTETSTVYSSTEHFKQTIENDTENNKTQFNHVTAVTPGICPNISVNCSLNCNGKNITQVTHVSNCNLVKKICYENVCTISQLLLKKKTVNTTAMDIAYLDKNKRKMYNLTEPTKKKLLKLCWETMFGQELVKLTMMDLVFVLLGTLFMDFFRALFVRYMNSCWCWDLEKKFPEYGDFKIAENILHLINNQGMVWMGMFFSPGLVVLNVVKLMIMMYLRSWAVMTCNVPHEVVFRVSKSNNFYLALLLTMLFLCVLPVGYTIVWVRPSWHCGPFSEYEKIYHILTININNILPDSLKFALQYVASPAIVIPLLVLLILIIYYLTSLTNSLREANNDLKIQLRRERTEERRKMFQLADTRRRIGSSAMDNTPFARWKRALPSLPMSKSIDSDDRKTVPDDANEPTRTVKKRGKGGIFAKIVGMALDKKTDIDVCEAKSSTNNVDEETDTDFHEALPSEILKRKDISIKAPEPKPTKTEKLTSIIKIDEKSPKCSKKLDDPDITIEKAIKDIQDISSRVSSEVIRKNKDTRKMNEKQTSESSNQSRQSDSLGSVIPVITISTTESDEEMLSKKEKKNSDKEKTTSQVKCDIRSRKSVDSKSLRRQSSVESRD